MILCPNIIQYIGALRHNTFADVNHPHSLAQY